MSDKKGGNKAPADTSALYLELSKFEKTQDFDKALKICNKILNVAPHDETAFHCKMVSLMQIGKFEDALKQIKDNHTFAGLDLRFEHAYCLYRLNKLSESLEVLDQIDSKVKSDKVKELKAQIHYRLGWQIYKNYLIHFLRAFWYFILIYISNSFFRTIRGKLRRLSRFVKEFI